MIDINKMLETNPDLIPQSLIKALVRQAAEVEVGRMYSASGLVPKEFQGNIAGCAVIVGMADRMGLDPLTLMQNVAFVSGRPTWKATFAIALANKGGGFKSGLQFKTTGTGRQMKVTCFAERADGRVVEETVTMEMAVADGWTKNPKYNSLPETMLSYRAAMFFVRKNCPELLFGLPAEDEVEQQPVQVAMTANASAAGRLAAIASRAAPELTGPVAGDPKIEEDWLSGDQQPEVVRADEPLAEQVEQQQSSAPEPETDKQPEATAEPEVDDDPIAEIFRLLEGVKNGAERLEISAGAGWRDDPARVTKALAWAKKAAAKAAADAKATSA